MSSPAFIFSSSSCSCFKALRNALLSRDVCSAFKSFFVLVSEHFSQRTSPAFSSSLCFQFGEKSIPHWSQISGFVGSVSVRTLFKVGFPSLSRIMSTISSRPTSIIKSILFTFGITFQSAEGGLGGGICNRVCSSCLLNAALAALCFDAWLSADNGGLELDDGTVPVVLTDDVAFAVTDVALV